MYGVGLCAMYANDALAGAGPKHCELFERDAS